MMKVKTFRCPSCGKQYSSLKLWTNHTLKMHPDEIPEGWTPAHYFYYTMTGKKCGYCVICKGPTEWNEGTMKYNRFCSNPECREKYREVFKQRMIGKYGKVTLLDDPEQQRKMIMNKKNSGYYTFDDGKVGYSSSYEYDFLKMCHQFLHMMAADILQPSPHTYYYNYVNENDKEHEGKHFYIPDFYIPSLNLEIEIKQNTSTHPKILRVDKVKEICKDNMMKTIKGINYIKIDDKQYGEFFDLVMRIREEIPEADLIKPRATPATESYGDEFKTTKQVLAYFKQNVKYAEFDESLGLLSNDVLFRRGRGSCHDQSWAVTKILRSMGKTVIHCFVSESNDSNKGGNTHSFCVYRSGNGGVDYIETAMEGNEGIHHFKSLEDVKAYFFKMHQADKFGWNHTRYPNFGFGIIGSWNAGMKLEALARNVKWQDDPAMEMTFNSQYERKGHKDLRDYLCEKIDWSRKSLSKNLKHVRFTRTCHGEVFMDQPVWVGYFMTDKGKTDDKIWITAFEIFPAYQGYGLGSQMLSRAVRLYHAERLSVNKKNITAIKMYKNFGFRKYDETEAMIFMELEKGGNENG